MTVAFRTHTVGAKAALAAYTALFDVGGAGSVKIFDGSIPATCETADAGTVLATFALPGTTFGAPTGASGASAVATANAITTVNASNSGTAQYFRAYDNAGTCVNQGSVGTATADMIVNTTTVTSGLPFAITSWTITLPTHP